MWNRAIIQRFVLPIADCTVIAEPFRFEPEPVHVSAYPSLSIPFQLVVRTVRAAFKLVKQHVDEDPVVHDWGFQSWYSGSDFAGRLRRRRLRSCCRCAER